MAVVAGSVGATATPADALMDILDTALGASGGWTQSGITTTQTAANASTTADCRIWKCTGGIKDFYACFEVDDTNARIRVRIAENWEDGGAAAGSIRRGSGGGTAATHADATSITPTSSDTTSESDIDWGTTNPNNQYSQVNTAAAGFGYIYKVENDKLTVATRSASVNSFAIVGEYTPLSTALTDSNPLFLARHAYTGAAYTPSVSVQGAVSFTRALGVGAVSTTGAFYGGIAPVHYPLYAGAPTPGASDNQGPHASSIASRFHTNTTFMSQAIVHGAANGMIQPRSHYRGYLEGFLGSTLNGTNTEPPVGDTIVVNGTTYYWLGVSFGAAASAASGDPILAVQA